MFRNKNDKTTQTKCSNTDSQVQSTKQKSGARKSSKRKREPSETDTAETKETKLDSPENSPVDSGSDSDNSYYAGEF